MGDSRNFTALDWVVGEINETLKQARQALESYVENPQDSSRLRFCLTYIHQVHGSLRMIEFVGGALLAEEMELLAQALINGSITNRAEAYEVLMRGILQLPVYLEQTKLKRLDEPATLLALLNDLRAVCGRPLLTESRFFTPDMRPSLRVDGALVPLPDAQFIALATKLRQIYQQAVTGYIRGLNIADNLTYLVKVFSRLHQLTRGSKSQSLWDIAWGLAELLQADGIGLSVSIKTLLRQLDREIKLLVVHGPAALAQPAPEALLRNLLYYIGQGDPVSSRLQRIHQDYALQQALPEPVSDDLMAVPDQDTLRAVVTALNDEIAAIKSALEQLVAGSSEGAGDDALQIMKRVADTLAVLGAGELRRQLLQQVDTLEQIVNGGGSGAEAIASVAGEIMSLERTLTLLVDRTSYGKSSPAQLEIDQAHRSVLREARNGLEQAKDAIVEYIASQWNREHLKNVPRFLDEVRGGLTMIPLPRAANILGICSCFITEQLIEQDVVPGWTTLDTLADAIASVEYYLERLVAGGDEDSDLLLGVAEDSLLSLGYGSSFDSTAAPSDTATTDLPASASTDDPRESTNTNEGIVASDPDDAIGSVEAIAASSVDNVQMQTGTTGDIDDDTASLSLESATEGANDSLGISATADAVASDESVDLTAEPALAAAWESTPSNMPADVTAASDIDEQRLVDSEQATAPVAEAESQAVQPAQPFNDDIDDEIIEIFIEEAGEVLEAIDEWFPPWAADFTHVEALKEFRRAFHTLKGSGRMVGALEIGELAWSVENMLNRVLDNTIQPCAAHAQFIRAVRELVPAMVEAFQQRQPNPQAALANEYQRWGESLARGVIPAQLQGEAGRQEEEEEDTTEDDLILWEIFGTEALSHLAVVEDFIAEMEDAAPLYTPPSDEMQRALHTLKGSAHMADITDIASLATPLERFVKELRTYQVSIDEDILQLIRDGVTYTKDALEQIKAGEKVEITKLDQYLARIAELKDLSVGPLIRLREAEGSDQRPVDPQLLSIFMAEEMRLLLDADTILDEWQQNPADSTPLQNLMVELTTLAKGAEHANLPPMAQLSRQLEALHKGLIEGAIEADAQIFDALLQGHEALLNMVDAVAAGQNLQPLPDSVQTLIDLVLTAPVTGFDSETVAAEVEDESEGVSEESAGLAGDELAGLVEQEFTETDATEPVAHELAPEALLSDGLEEGACAAEEFEVTEFEAGSPAADDAAIDESVTDEPVAEPLATLSPDIASVSTDPVESTEFAVVVEPDTEQLATVVDHDQVPELEPADNQAIGIDNPGLMGAALIDADTSTADATNPDITSPDAINPDAADSEAIDPYTTDPEVIDPYATQVAVTDKDVTDTDGTGSNAEGDLVGIDLTGAELADSDSQEVGSEDTQLSAAEVTTGNDDASGEPAEDIEITLADATELVQAYYAGVNPVGAENDHAALSADASLASLPETSTDAGADDAVSAQGFATPENASDNFDQSTGEYTYSPLGELGELVEPPVADVTATEPTEPTQTEPTELEAFYPDATEAESASWFIEPQAANTDDNATPDNVTVAVDSADAGDAIKTEIETEIDAEMAWPTADGAQVPSGDLDNPLGNNDQLAAADDHQDDLAAIDTASMTDSHEALDGSSVAPDTFVEALADAMSEADTGLADLDLTDAGTAMSALEAAGDELAVSGDSMDETADASEPAVATTTESVVSMGSEPVPAMALPDDVDMEIVDIFMEEASELLEEIDESIHTWEADWNSDSSNESLQRVLHTLKGGARLAGLTQLGDLAHDFESLIIGADSSGGIDQPFFQQLHHYQDQIITALEQARIGFLAMGDNSPAPTLSAPAVDTYAVVPGADAADSESGRADGLDRGNEFGSSNDYAFGDSYSYSNSDGNSDATDAVGNDLLAGAAANGSGPWQAAAGKMAEILPFTPKQPAPQSVAPAPLKGAAAPKSAAPTPLNVRRSAPQEVVKVSAELLEVLVNLAGETSISRGQIEEQISDMGYTLEEMDATLQRLHEQLRRLDIETEAQILFRQEQLAEDENFDPLEMDRYSQLQQLSRSLIESASDLQDLKLTLADKTRDTETLLLQQSRINTELQEGLMRSRMVPFSRLVPRLRRIVRQVSGELNKQVNFELENVEGEMDRSVMERMVAPLEHMLRNAVDHGIETVDQRLAVNKPAEGLIRLSLGREGGDVVLRMRDDGQGINLAKVKAKAIERGLMSADANLSDRDIMQFILHSGFSTADTISQISGRGVGMDVVHAEIKQLGGSMQINSVPGQGTEFIIHLPFTVSVNRALMVRMGEEAYAIPLNTIEGIVRVSPFELEHYYQNDDARFEYAGEQYQVRYLGRMLNRDVHARLEGQTMPMPVILVRSGNHTVAMQVDQLMGSREIVVKSLGAQFSAVVGVSGATVMGDGRVVVILDPHAMIRREAALLQENATVVMDTQPLETQVEKTRTIMVIDDSVTVRKVTTRCLEREGYNVITAKDGVEALQILQDHIPDVMLLDIEMPRMDGFEVAKNVRTSSIWRQIPIIMITSRTGQKHREHAHSLGVNIYMGKPFQEEQLLENIRTLTGEQSGLRTH